MRPVYRLDGDQYSAFVFAPADHRLEPECASIHEVWGAREGNAALRNRTLRIITGWSPTAIRAMLRTSAPDGWTAGGIRVGRHALGASKGGFHEKRHSSPSDGVRWAATIRSSQDAGRNNSILPRPGNLQSRRARRSLVLDHRGIGQTKRDKARRTAPNCRSPAARRLLRIHERRRI